MDKYYSVFENMKNLINEEKSLIEIINEHSHHFKDIDIGVMGIVYHFSNYINDENRKL